MFRGVSVQEAIPLWGHTGMTTAKWMLLPTCTVAVDQLVLTQPGIYFAGLWNTRTRPDGDDYPHVVEWRNTLYLEDGHHRVVRAALDGAHHVIVRKLRVD